MKWLGQIGIGGVVAICVTLVSVVIFAMDFTGVLGSLPWLAQRIPTMALLAIGIIASYIVSENYRSMREIANLKSPLRELLPGLSSPQIFIDSFQNAKEEIDILALSGRICVDSYRNLFPEKIRHVNIRILILDPESDMAGFRADEEPEKGLATLAAKTQIAMNYFEEIKETITKRIRQGGSFRGSVHVKTYKTIPYFGYTRFDDFCLVSQYFLEQFGVSSPVIEVSSNAQIFQHYKRHFDRMWDRADSKIIIIPFDIATLVQSEDIALQCHPHP